LGVRGLVEAPTTQRHFIHPPPPQFTRSALPPAQRSCTGPPPGSRRGLRGPTDTASAHAPTSPAAAAPRERGGGVGVDEDRHADPWARATRRTCGCTRAQWVATPRYSARTSGALINTTPPALLAAAASNPAWITGSASTQSPHQLRPVAGSTAPQNRAYTCAPLPAAAETSNAIAASNSSLPPTSTVRTCNAILHFSACVCGGECAKVQLCCHRVEELAVSCPVDN